MNKVDAVAVLKGLGVNLLLSFILDFVAKNVTGSVPAVTPAVSLVISLVIGLLCCFASGYMTALSARQEPMLNVLVLCGVLVVLGIVLAFTAKFPLWYSIASLAMLVPFTYAGGYMFIKKGVRS